MPSIPVAIRDNAIWATITLIGFLFVFYVNATYVRADELNKHEYDVLHAMEMGRLQDQIYAAEDQILMLEIYMEESPGSDLNRARERRKRELEIKLKRLEREYQEEASL